MCDDVKYFKSSIPPKLEGDRIGSFLIKVLKFHINDEIKGSQARIRLMLWGQDDGIDIYHSKCQNEGKVSVEYPLVGSIDAVTRYILDMGVLVLPIVHGEENLIGLATINLSERFHWLVGDLEKRRYDVTPRTSCASLSTPLIALTKTNEKCHFLTSVRFGELDFALELTIYNSVKFDCSKTFSHNHGIDIRNKAAYEVKTDVIETANTRSGPIVSVRHNNGESGTVRGDPGEQFSSFNFSDNFHRIMSVLRENRSSVSSVMKNCGSGFFDLDDSNLSLTTENDSILLAAILENPGPTTSAIEEDLECDGTERMSIDTMMDTKTGVMKEQRLQSAAQTINSKQTRQRTHVEQKPAIRVIRLCVTSVNLTRSCLSPLFDYLNSRHIAVKGWVEVAIPSFNDPLLSEPRIFNVLFIRKTIGLKREGRTTRAKTNARGRSGLVKNFDKQLLACFETCHELSPRKIWNLKLRNTDEIELSIELNVFTEIKEIEKCTTRMRSNTRSSLNKDTALSIKIRNSITNFEARLIPVEVRRYAST